MKTFAIILAVFLAVVIVVLLGILIFVKPVQGPTIPSENLQIDLPQPNAIISSPVAIEGSVNGGGWFFEGLFPVKILDAGGNVIGAGHAQALSDWMSTGTVPFSASIVFAPPSHGNGATGAIVFANDNPSGLAQNAKSLSVPVVFK